MADIKKKGFHTVVSRSQEEYEMQLRKHRLRMLKRAITAAVVILLLAGGTVLYMSLRQYTDYDVRVSVERSDISGTQFREFQGNILKYSNDGALYADHNNEMIWNQTYEMSNPTVDICQGYLTIYDKAGKDIYILTKDGLAQSIETNYPIIQVSVAGQGTVAVLMDNQSSGRLALYDKEGNELVDGAIHGERGGYPVAIALSDDAIKLAVSMLDINDGSIKSTLAFYNFGTVGENAIDHVVSANTYEDMLIPELDFISQDCMIAISDTGVIVYEGTQKPKETARIELTGEAESIFYNEKYVGVVYNSSEEGVRHSIHVYDTNGKLMMEELSDVEYTNVELLSSDEICISDGTICDIYSVKGVYKFHYEFDKELYCVIPGGSGLNYTFILNGVTEQARLK